MISQNYLGSSFHFKDTRDSCVAVHMAEIYYKQKEKDKNE